MSGMGWGVIAAGVALVVGAGCGPSTPPSLAIVNPTNGSTVPLGTDASKSVTVDFVVKNFTVKASCGGSSGCGQVWCLIDGAACDPVGLTYNALAVASPATAQFAACPTPTGTHAVSLELHRDDGTAVKDASGQTVAAAVNITTQ